MYKACRCEVCGEVYLGTEKPDTCPFCGAHKLHMETMEDDELRSLLPRNFDVEDAQDKEDDVNLFVDLDKEDLPEISSGVMEKILERAKDYGILEAYTVFAEEVSTEAADKFFEKLGDLDKDL